MSIFLEEIRSQPEVLRARLRANRADVMAAAEALRKADLRGLMIAARGSSDHAAVYAKYLFEMRNRLPVVLAAPSEFTMYRRPPRLEGFGVMAISQSGASPDVVAVIEEARAQGCPTLAVVNEAGSPLANTAAFRIDIGAGLERSVPASKTYTGTLLCLALLSVALDPEPALSGALDAIPDAARAALEAGSERLAECVDGERMLVVGRGYHLATALEIALKVTETTTVLAEARSAADFLHGPIAATRPGLPVLLVSAQGPVLGDLTALGAELEARRARVLSISDAGPAGERAVRADTGLPELLTPIPFGIAGQVFAEALARRRGLDPDRPAGLRKVTETR